MKTLQDLLTADSRLSGYKINITGKESCELFFVKGKLETVRRTDTRDTEVTVYADHDGCRGDAQFIIYPSTTPEQIAALIDDAASKALLIHNPHYELPSAETGEYTVASNFAEYAPMALAEEISHAVFCAISDAQASLNSVEIFINQFTDQVVNSRGLHKSQVRYTAMVEAIPTYNGGSESVELYQQYNFSFFDPEVVRQEVAAKLEEVKARCAAIKPELPLNCPVVLNKEELAQLFMNIAYDLNYASVYSHSNLWHKGDPIQSNPLGDRLGITMSGEAEGSVRSAKFDNDGMSLKPLRIVEDGKAVAYFGSNRYGQYLGEVPTGELRCLCADCGTVQDCTAAPCLEVISMSGLQVDFFSDYIGGEVRLAYYHNGEATIPVTGISISGKLSQVLDHIRLSVSPCVFNGYTGPEKAILSHMTIF